MVSHKSLLYLAILMGMGTAAQSSSANVLGFNRNRNTKRYPINIQCSDDDEQEKVITDMTLLMHYAQGPLDWLQNSFDENANFYNHYFRPEDRERVTGAFNAFRQAPVKSLVDSFPFTVRCVPYGDKEIECDGGQLAVADPIPETFGSSEVSPGIRQIGICPDYFDTDSSIAEFPFDAIHIQAYCLNAYVKGNKYAAFETGTHTLMHEVSHLDRWGLFAGMEIRTEPASGKLDEFDYHGTIDYDDGSKDSSSATIARGLRNGVTDTKTYWNAESLAAFALEYFASTYCGVNDVPL